MIMEWAAVFHRENAWSLFGELDPWNFSKGVCPTKQLQYCASSLIMNSECFFPQVALCMSSLWKGKPLWWLSSLLQPGSKTHARHCHRVQRSCLRCRRSLQQHRWSLVGLVASGVTLLRSSHTETTSGCTKRKMAVHLTSWTV